MSDWLEECAKNYREMAETVVPIVRKVFNVQGVDFVIVEPADFNYKLVFRYRGLDVTIQYISGCGNFFVTVLYSGYNEKYIDNMPVESIEFEKLFNRIKSILDLIDY